MNRLDDLDRKMWKGLRRGRTSAELYELAARRWWVPMVAGVSAPAVVAALSIPFGVPAWWIIFTVVVTAAFSTIPMTFMAGYCYAEHRRQQGSSLPWWMNPYSDS